MLSNAKRTAPPPTISGIQVFVEQRFPCTRTSTIHRKTTFYHGNTLGTGVQLCVTKGRHFRLGWTEVRLGRRQDRVFGVRSVFSRRKCRGVGFFFQKSRPFMPDRSRSVNVEQYETCTWASILGAFWLNADCLD